MIYKIQKDTIENIVRAIKKKLGDKSNNNYLGADIPSKIWEIDTNQPMTSFPNGLLSGYNGVKVARIAATYHRARTLGIDRFMYDQDSLFTEKDTTNTPKNVRSFGKAAIDCSTFVGLCLRGITYEKSPYNIYPKNSNVTWLPTLQEIENMCGNDGWEFRELDRQREGVFNNIGIPGYSTIRFAADFAEYFYKCGFVVYDRKATPSISPRDPSIIKSLLPGDILFWAKPTASDAQKERFRSISHIGIVAERTDRFYQVTGFKPNFDEYGNKIDPDLDPLITTPESGQRKVVFYSPYDTEKQDTIVMICRPDYRQKSYVDIPLNYNLISYPWSWGTTNPNEYIDPETGLSCGVIFTTGINKNGESTITINGHNTKSISRNLKGGAIFDDVRDLYDKIVLSPGTYRMDGMNGTGINNVGLSLQLLRLEKKNNSYEINQDNPIRVYDGHQQVFTITESIDARIVLYIGSNEGNGYYFSNISICPKLEKISN